jgi:predicted transcriptional regulator
MRKAAARPQTEDTEALRYRTKVEVLRDILRSTEPPSSKSRIVRLANLNPVSFDHYLAFCVGAGLLESTGTRYRRTDSGQAVITAIDRLVKKAEELGFAVEELGSCIGQEEPRVLSNLPVLRMASAEAWEELARRGARSGGYTIETVGGLPRPGRARTRRVSRPNPPARDLKS